MYGTVVFALCKRYLCTRVYIERAKPLRSSSKLFVSTVKPHGPVSKDTISRWVKASLRIAGIDTSVFKPHSTKAAATSAAQRRRFADRDY